MRVQTNGASAEIVSILIRGGKGHFHFGDPYEFIVTAVFISPTEVYLKGLLMRVEVKFTKDHYRIIHDCLASYGVTTAHYERKTDNARNVTAKVRP